MKYLNIKNDRLHNGYLVDVRSYQLEKAKRGGYDGIRVHVLDTGRWIIIPKARFDQGEVGKEKYKSQFPGGKDYYLIQYSVTSDTEKAKKKEPVQTVIEDATRKAYMAMSDKDREALRTKLGLGRGRAL